ncbi:ribosomal RNA methyltransferase MRM2 [Didymella exigua CBS 183.55]|uniref:rRNA methyltransferase 2, mitochondrial n=1 Tax=Didymella exigua CBS 183.55 TaxID=1150837 RepID=A0A6A5RPU6_9PLEO|nr:ribosomal RNA methyltransferase MRM2 [Didymella exigua CBS 183.55]KAF1930385.1 ribosomal RNA methyltransferase MRM2 [Didymella exigua CBS 183.55]
MLSRRVFRQLTDSVLLEPGTVTGPLCLAASCRSGRTPSQLNAPRARHASSSSTRWKTRQGNDPFAREARVQGLKSRAAFKLLELNEKHKLFQPGQTVVDLGFAPGSWSQVAVNRTAPDGRVIGIDVIPAQPPRGVSTIQGNFLSPDIQDDVRAYVRDPTLGRPRKRTMSEEPDGLTEEQVDEMERGYIDIERQAHMEGVETERLAEDTESGSEAKLSVKERDLRSGRVVDVVLSDMMMNTSGNSFRDHAGSMDLCMAALTFAFDTLKTGGHFLCKFYQGSEDKAFETKLKRLFAKVSREKPESSRAASKEAYFVALRRKEAPTREEVFRD